MNEWWFFAVISSFAVAVSALLIRPLISGFIGRALGLISIAIFSAAGYFVWGDYFSWNGFLQQQRTHVQAQALMKTIKSPQEVIDKIQQRLREDPESAQGWFLLGRLYDHQEQSDKALTAFAKAHQLEPNNEQYTVHYAHGLWMTNNQEFNDVIRGIFKNLLAQNPNQPDALAMLAMDSYLNKDYKQAVGYWKVLLKLAPAQSDEAKAIRQAIAKAEREGMSTD